MEIIINNQGTETLVELVGRLDTLAAQEINPQMTGLQEKADGVIILDCKKLEYISSSGLRLFLTLRKSAAVKGGKVIVRSISPEIRNVFMMTGFLNLFQVED